MRMPRERRLRVPGSSTDRSKIFTFSTKHPDQFIQWGWGKGEFFSRESVRGVNPVTQLSCRADFQNEWKHGSIHLYILKVCKGTAFNLPYFSLFYVIEITNSVVPACSAALYRVTIKEIDTFNVM
jgi:hypothetical protein